MKDLKKNLSSFFRITWPLIILLLITFTFFWKVILLKEVPFPGDFVVGVYHPWLDYKWGYTVGVPVKNPILTDVPSFIYPMQMFAVSTLKRLEIPLWNNLILGGSPILANFQSAVFSPTNFLYLVTNQFTAWSLQIILQHVLLFVFTYLLLRNWKLSKLSSLLGGTIFAFSGFNIIWSQWNGHVLTSSFIPLLLLIEDKLLQTKKIRYAFGLSFALCLQILSGYPQVVLYTGVSMGILFLIRLNSLRRKELIYATFLFGIFTILGIGLASFQILPGKELLSLSQRQVEPNPFEWTFLPWTKIITFISSDFFGNHATKNYWGPQDYTSNTGFVGIVAFILASLAILVLHKRNEVRFSIILLITSLILALPTPISIFIWKSGLLGFNAASAHRSLVIFNLAMALLAAFGFGSLKSTKKIRPKIVAITIPIILIAVFSFYAFTIRNQSVFQMSIFKIAIKNTILPVFILIVSSLILFKPKLKAILVILSIIELFYFGWKFTPFVKKELIFPNTPVLSYLQNQNKPFRVIADKVIPINFLMNYGIETLEGYDAVYPTRISQFVAAINGNLGSENSIRRYAIIDNYFSKLEDIANVKYFVILKSDYGLYSKNSKFEKVFEDNETLLLMNKDALPRASLFYKWRVENDDNKILNTLSSDKFNINKEIIINSPAPFNPPFSKPISSVQYIKYDSNESIIRTETSTNAMLFISDTYYPGWRAYVDGVETKIYQADFTFRAIPIEKGIHNIRMVYKPESFSQGIKISLVSLGISFIIGIGLKIWKRRS